MKYNYSHLDEKNLSWFANDMTRATLASIWLKKGERRGLNDFEIEFKYPITVIAGANCSGKSTLLTLAACAFHNSKYGFKPLGRKTTYYTMSDFFVQSSEEVPVEGINIWYKFLYNNWRRTREFPDGIGRGWQSRSKKRGGKWSNYSRRVSRNVVFLGIERVVPHSERSVSKSYRYSFVKDEGEEGYEKDVSKIVGKILSKKYDQFWFAKHSKYRLAHVVTKGSKYSGFNMGAGENALFEILSTIYACSPGMLLVIDEIELGLHEKAQRKFMQELKKICFDRKMQVICTTHSAPIIDCVPPEGRFFVEKRGNETVITNGISSAYAAGRLAGENTKELDIFVEDGIAEELIQALLPTEIRQRINILPIGSATAVARQLAARNKEQRACECMAILDGDQRNHIGDNRKTFINALETIENQEETEYWFDERTAYLPGETWPEKWVFSQANSENIRSLAETFRVPQDQLLSYFEEALLAGKHNEIITLSNSLYQTQKNVVCPLCNWVTREREQEFSNLAEKIIQFLD